MSFFPIELMAGLSAAAGILNPIPQPGEEGYRAVPSHHFRILYENDTSFGTDSNYTHGTRFDYAQRLGDSSRWWGLSLTQNMFTPETHSRGAVWNEHPYAGYLALGAGYLITGENFGASFEFQLGTTGKPSCAEDFQYVVHRVGDMETWDGWHDQIPSEVTFQLTMRQDWRLPFLETKLPWGLQTDGSAYMTESLGTVRIAASAGVNFRIGHNLPPVMQQNGNLPGNFGVSLLEKPEYNPEKISYFLSMSAGLEYVARDLFVDGGVFHHFDQTCSRVPWQAEARVGLCVLYQGIEYHMGVLFQSDSYRTQKDHAIIGSFSIGWNW